MYIDNLLEFADAQNLTATGPSTDHVDLSSSALSSTRVWLLFQLDASPDGASGDETYSAALQTDDNAGFSSPTALVSFAVPRGTPAGTRYALLVPTARVERYLRLALTLGGTTPSITFSAWITDQEPASWQAYPDAVS